MERQPLNILVVDDDVALTLFISKCLTSEGHRVVTATNNAKVQMLLKTEKFDIAIADLVLPGSDGSDIIKELKRMDPAIYCALISGYYNESFDNYKVLVGADEVIGKPVTKEILSDIVRRRNELRAAPGKTP